MRVTPTMVIAIVGLVAFVLLIKLGKRVAAGVISCLALIVFAIIAAANLRTANTAATLARTANATNTWHIVVIIGLILALGATALVMFTALGFAAYFGLRWKLGQLPSRQTLLPPKPEQHPALPEVYEWIQDQAEPLMFEPSEWGFSWDSDDQP